MFSLKKLVLLLSALSIFSLAGCAVPPKTIGAPTVVTEESIEEKSFPTLGSTNISEIGDNLYEEYRKVLETKYDVVLKGSASGAMEVSHSISIAQGTKGKLQAHKIREGEKLICFNAVTDGTLGSPQAACLVDSNGDGYFDGSMFKGRDRYFPLDNKVAYDLLPTEREYVASTDSFQRIVLYQGVTKGTINISFREFYDGSARPAFTQDIVYDLDNNGEALIAFKGMRIRVLGATNTSITYIVDSPFGGSISR